LLYQCILHNLIAFGKEFSILIPEFFQFKGRKIFDLIFAENHLPE
jgi:hypothetical protein